MVHILLWLGLSVLLNKLAIVLSLLTSDLAAHEMTPAYPVLKLSHVSGIVKAEMSLFNSREDVSYYQIEVFDLNWNNLPFSTTYKIMRVDYKERRDFDVYIRKSDLDIATYICSTSNLHCSNAVGGGTNLEFGVTGVISNMGGSFTASQDKDVGIYARVVIPLDKPKSRVNCDDLYQVELAQRRLEIQKLRNELNQLKNLQEEMNFEN